MKDNYGDKIVVDIEGEWDDPRDEIYLTLRDSLRKPGKVRKATAALSPTKARLLAGKLMSAAQAIEQGGR